MKREFTINLVFLVLINLLIKPFYIFGIDRTVQNLVGPEEFGLFWALFNFVYLFQVLNDLGIQNFSNTFISQNRSRARKYVPLIGSLKILASLAFIGVVILASVILGYAQYWKTYLAFLVINQIIVSFIFFLRANLAGLGYYRWDSVMSVLDKAFMIVIVGVMILNADTWGFSIYDFVYAQTASLVFTFIILVLVNQSLSGRLRLSWHWPTLVVLMKKSAPFALTFILTVIYTRVDSVMLERMLPNGPYESGVYVSGFRLLEASNMLVYLFIGLLLPMMSYLHEKKKEGEELFWLGLKSILVVSVTLGILFSAYSDEIMSLLYVNADEYWSEVMSLLMLGFIGMALAHMAGASLLANHQVKKCNWIYAFGMVLNIVLNLILIPKMAATGAATATLITQFFVALASLYLVFRYVGFGISWPVILHMLFFTALVILATFCLILYPVFSLWYMDLLAVGVFFAVVAMMSGLLPLKDILKDRLK